MREECVRCSVDSIVSQTEALHIELSIVDRGCQYKPNRWLLQNNAILVAMPIEGPSRKASILNIQAPKTLS